MLPSVNFFWRITETQWIWFISEYFTLNSYIFLPLTDKNYYLHCNTDLSGFFDAENVIEDLSSVAIVVSCNTCVGPLPRTKKRDCELSPIPYL